MGIRRLKNFNNWKAEKGDDDGHFNTQNRLKRGAFGVKYY